MPSAKNKSNHSGRSWAQGKVTHITGQRVNYANDTGLALATRQRRATSVIAYAAETWRSEGSNALLSVLFGLFQLDTQVKYLHIIA